MQCIFYVIAVYQSLEFTDVDFAILITLIFRSVSIISTLKAIFFLSSNVYVDFYK